LSHSTVAMGGLALAGMGLPFSAMVQSSGNRAKSIRQGFIGIGGRGSWKWHRLILALRENKQPDWDTYDSVTSSAISPVTEASVTDSSKPEEFPDFTNGKQKTDVRE